MSYGMSDFLVDLCKFNTSPDDVVLEYLSNVDRSKLKLLLKRLERVRKIDPTAISHTRKQWNATNTAVRTHVHAATKSVQGVQAKIVGALLERIVQLAFDGCKLVSTVHNFRTTTAEVDLMVQFGPLATVLPFFRLAGSHLIGEAKCYSSGFKAEWVNELVGLMSQHQTTHSVLFVASPQKKLRADHRHGIQLHSAKGAFVVPFGLTQMLEVANGKNFLSVLSSQYLRVINGMSDLAI